MNTLLLFSIFVLLLLLRVPIAFALGISSAVMLYLEGFNLYMIPQRMFAGVDSSTLIAIPGFVFAGVLMARGGIAKNLIESVKAWIGHLPGGMALVTVVSCMVFAAISGSSPATAAAIGSIMIPGMIQAGYDKKYAMGLVAAAGTLGILIPPSITLILYGVVTEQSIGKLFMAGVIPGIFLGVLLMMTAIVYAKVKGYKSETKATMQERLTATKKAVWAYLLPVLILGVIYTGIATPTEAAVVSAFYAIFVSFFIYKNIGWKDIRLLMRDTVSTSAMIYVVISAAMLFALYLTNEQIPQQFTALITESNVGYWSFLALVCFMYFIMGMFLEAVSVVLITVPILLPVLKMLGVDLVHFAIILVISIELAMITPPVGLNLFVVKSIAKEKLSRVVLGVLPFIIIMLIGLAFIVVFPDLSLFLPSRM